MTKPIPVHRDMFNEFEAPSGSDSLNFVNGSARRDNVTQVEIYSAHTRHAIDVKSEDNIAMALSILGIGRVTDEVEALAQTQADRLLDAEYPANTDSVLKQAVINLRAILIAQQREQEGTEKLTEDAYALYKTVYPNNPRTLAEFRLKNGFRDYWIDMLKRLRNDPTILGSL